MMLYCTCRAAAGAWNVVLNGAQQLSRVAPLAASLQWKLHRHPVHSLLAPRHGKQAQSRLGGKFLLIGIWFRAGKLKTNGCVQLIGENINLIQTLYVAMMQK